MARRTVLPLLSVGLVLILVLACGRQREATPDRPVAEQRDARIITVPGGPAPQTGPRPPTPKPRSMGESAGGVDGKIVIVEPDPRVDFKIVEVPVEEPSACKLLVIAPPMPEGEPRRTYRLPDELLPTPKK